MKRWYVVQIYAGYEAVIKKDIEKRIVEKKLGDLFGEVLIPSAKARQAFGTASKVARAGDKTEQQLFPGYLLIEMETLPEAMRLVQTTPKVLKFLGGRDPVPLSQKEIDRVISQIKGEVVLAPKKSEFIEGAEIEIAEGPFAGFVGVIETIDEESERLTVMVSIFGRMTPIDLGFNQVKQ